MIGTKPYKDPHSEHDEVSGILTKLRKLGATSYILTDKAGQVRDMWEIITREETIAIMAATLYTAADAAGGELKRKAPKYIRLVSEDATGLIVPVGKNYVLLVSGKPGEQGLESKIDEIQEIAREAATKV